MALADDSSPEDGRDSDVDPDLAFVHGGTVSVNGRHSAYLSIFVLRSSIYPNLPNTIPFLSFT